MEIKYYDERYYLSRFGARERKLLEYWKEKNRNDNEIEKIKHQSLITSYKSYIQLASRLIKEISLDNSISKCLMISVLVQASVFSYEEFKCDNADDILNSTLGLNVINGRACCRNVSNFITDIFKVNNDFCENIAVMSLSNKDKRKAIREKANHMINLINYEGILYGFDSLYQFGSLYYFLNSFELLPVDSSLKTYLYYKPYIDFVFNYWSVEDMKNRLNEFKENNKSRINVSEFKDIIIETHLNLAKYITLVQDFMKDTNGEITDIKEKIKMIKK